MGSVTKVKKRENVIGGSARQSYVNSIHGIEGFCFSLPIIGHLLRHCIRMSRLLEQIVGDEL